jgi:hypothetical protein
MLKNALIALTIISTAIADRSNPAILASKSTPESLITAKILVENIKVKPMSK